MTRWSMRAVAGALALLALAPAGAAWGAAIPTVPLSYRDPANWLARASGPAKRVDVFYLYPSSYSRPDAQAPIIAPVDAPSMRKGARQSFARQAWAFKPVANLWAPYYRQVDLKYALSLPLPKRNAIVGRTPTTDARAAFAHFITHDNHGRPFVLVSHSQGSQVMLNLLAGYIRQHPAVQRRMIAAYVIGVSVTRGYLRDSHQRFATGAGDTGVLVSYNTETTWERVPNPIVGSGGIAINPITWSRGTARATARQSLGSYLPDRAGRLRKVAHYADARIDTRRGVIVCSTCNVGRLAPGNPIVAEGILHQFDYPLYFYNLRENARLRIQHFLRGR